MDFNDTPKKLPSRRSRAWLRKNAKRLSPVSRANRL
jgi:hypothetical protein